MISRELKQMRQEEDATRALLRRRQREVEAAARKQMSMEDISRGGLTLKARGRRRRPLKALDQNTLFQSDTVAIV
ncbi:hypothetical protein PR003_g17068 [Phytophthora rubi]|uniref:Uncharacterized protein n=1 Tax=Phytophthora rubi TaxID=129364 RepID=A0A6A4ER81_9STRA|nr:hypothetical protein PR003_g17068 [Phytophthora rubi]